jgi:vacuolar protein sorting-associated protein IST1
MADAALKKKVTAAASTTSSGPGGKIPDVDELSRRFAQLKR